MKYIITEAQNTKLYIIRRIYQDWKWITEIVEEGLDIDNPCDFKNEEIYFRRVSKDSAKTYLYNFMDYSEGKEVFEILVFYLTDLIENKLGPKIVEYYQDIKPDCEEF